MAQENNYAQKPVEFPSHLVDPARKMDKDWMLGMCQAYHWKFNKYGPAVFRNRLSELYENRRYGKGKQSIDQYKKRLGVMEEYDRDKKSWRNLDWSVLQIAPRFKRVILGKIKNSQGRIKVKAIDPISVDMEKQYKANLQEWVMNRDLLMAAQEKLGAKIGQPIDPNLPMPDTMEDVEVHMNLHYKDRYAMEMQDALELTFQKNEWDALSQDIIEDLIEVGYGGTRTYLDKENNLRTRRCIPERLGVWGSKHKDMRDAKAVWEYVDVNLNEFVELTSYLNMTRKQAKELFDEAHTFINHAYNGYFYPDKDYYNFDNWEDRATVMDLRFTSVDTFVHQVGVNRYGNQTISRKNLEWYDPSKTYPEGSQNEVIVNEVVNVYECKWLVGTDFIWDYGPATNMPADLHDLGNTKLGYTLYSTDDQSVISQIIPVLDQIQINWLQFQSHIAKSKPQGIEIEMSAFEDINLGKSMEKMTPRQVIQMYYDTGNIVWRRKDWSGRDGGWKPIMESKAILPDGAYQHLDIIVRLINFLREISGLNEVVDGSTPRPDIGKTVSELAAVNSNNALQYLFHAWDWIYEGTAKTMATLIPEQVNNGPVEGMINSLGENSVRFFQLDPNLTYRDFGIEIIHKPSDDDKVRLQQYVNIALEQGQIDVNDAFEIDQEDNLIRAAQMLAVKRKRKLDQEQAMKMQETEMLSMQQQQSNAQTAQNTLQIEQMKWQLEMQKEKFLSDLRVREDRDKKRNELIVEKVRMNQELTVQEKDLLNKLIIAREGNETDLQQSLIIAKAQIESTKAAGKAPNATKQIRNKQIDN